MELEQLYAKWCKLSTWDKDEKSQFYRDLIAMKDYYELKIIKMMEQKPPRNEMGQ